MGFFGAFTEGRFAAKVIKHMADMLNVTPRTIPEWMKESTKKQARGHIQAGLSPEEVAQMKVDMMKDQILEDIRTGGM